MTLSAKEIKPGSELISPGGRHVVVSDVLVPKNSPEAQVPSQFKNYARKLVRFTNDTMTTLVDIQHHYRCAE